MLRNIDPQLNKSHFDFVFNFPDEGLRKKYTTSVQIDLKLLRTSNLD